MKRKTTLITTFIWLLILVFTTTLGHTATAASDTSKSSNKSTEVHVKISSGDENVEKVALIWNGDEVELNKSGGSSNYKVNDSSNKVADNISEIVVTLKDGTEQRFIAKDHQQGNEANGTVNYIIEVLSGDSTPGGGDVENPGDGDVENPGGGDVENPGGGDVENPGGGDIENPGGGDVENPGGGDVENPGGGDVENPGGGDVENPGGGDIENPGDGDVENPGGGDVENPGGGDVENPGGGDVENPGGGDVENPGGGDVENPGDGDVENPGGGDVENPGDGDVENPGGGDVENPGGGDVENPDDGEDNITLEIGMTNNNDIPTVNPPADKGNMADENIIELPDEEIPAGTPNIISDLETTDVIILEEEIPGVPSKLPKTGGIPSEVFYVIGMLITGSGVFIKLKKKQS